MFEMVGLGHKAQQPHAIHVSYPSRLPLVAMRFSITLTPVRLRIGIVAASVPATKLPAQLESTTTTELSILVSTR